MDVGTVRKRLVFAIEAARKDAADRRARADRTAKAYEAFLENVAVPAFRLMAAALRGQNLLFDVATPSGGVRLVADRQRDDGISLELDSTADPPTPLVSITRTRGGRVIQRERAVRDQAAIADLTEEDVVAMLLEELKPWLA